MELENVIFKKSAFGFHIRCHLFMHYGWFLQNHEKYFIQPYAHITVVKYLEKKSLKLLRAAALSVRLQ